ncbi:Predicted dithiol-disulfide isomerase, DsbA family [Jannaschia faecimaris]|uniref:Predicted dithiol-disulfide isomerase, DsbA family n=2 Tax=Jannaschia faecimaris TaxID=1244108 RepID=A0A1H3L733_9RHOB|nr:Predicted dithiol-disulfide isomerase, DsbA family [Jannaschia faecimaris]
MDRRTYLETKFGGKEAAVRAYAPVVEAAESAGLQIDFEGIKITPNTINAHRLIHWAGLEQKQTHVVQALFEAYFEKGRDIGDVPTLVDIGVECGLDRDLLERLFASDADMEETRARDAHARERGVSGVPTFVVANQHVLRGAQSPEVWGEVIEQILEQLRAQEREADKAPPT